MRLHLSFALVFLFLTSCTQSLEEQQLARMMSWGTTPGGPSSAYFPQGSSGGGSGTYPSLPLSSPELHAKLELVDGVPHKSGKGFCGNNIVEGGEQCDGGAVPKTKCRDLPGGVAGDLRCGEDCMLDIGGCVTTEIDRAIGGKAERCKCNCDPSLCQGTCASIGASGSAKCFFDCRRRNCTCQCEDLMDLSFDSGQIQCECITDAVGNPNCACSLDQIEVTSVLKPNLTAPMSRIVDR